MRNIGREDVLHLVDIFYQHGLVAGDHGNDVVETEVAKDARLNLNLLRVGLPLDFVAGFQFKTGHHVGLFKHLHRALL